VSVKNKVLNGLKWSVLSKLIVQIFSWASTFLIIRILTPNDYGIIAIVTVFFSLVHIFAVNGFVSALVKNRSADRLSASQIFTLSLIVYLLFSFLLSFFAESISHYYDNEKIENAMYVMAIFVPLLSFCVVPNANLNRKMNFKIKAKSETISALGGTGVALVCVYSGAEFWALIYSRIAEIILSAITLNYMQKSEYGLTLSLKSAKPMFMFAAKIQLNGFIWFVYNKIDTLIIGKLLGIQPLGIYNAASEIASMPMTKVSSILNQVGFSAFVSTNNDIDASKYYLARSIRLLSLAVFPVFFGISAVANEITAVFLGSQWLDAAMIISILVFAFPLRMINATFNSFSNAMGEARFSLENTMIIASILVSAIIIGVQYGLVETAIAWVVGFSSAFSIILYRIQKKFKIRAEIIFNWVSPLFISLTMWAIIMLIEIFLLPATMHLVGVLLIKMMSGVVFICTAYMLFHKSEILQLLDKGK